MFQPEDISIELKKVVIKSTGQEVSVKSAIPDRYDPSAIMYELEDENGTVWNGQFLYWPESAVTPPFAKA